MSSAEQSRDLRTGQLADHPHPAQGRTLRALACAQVIGGIGIGASVSVGALLAQDLSGSAAWSGMAATLTTLGAAAWALPLAQTADVRGRRAALTTGWLIAAAGAVGAVLAATAGSFLLLLPALLLMGAGNAANLQSRFAATDLASTAHRGRSLALVVWSTTLGAVAGPNLTRPGAAVARALGIPELSGPFVFSAVAALAAAAVLMTALRPDPLLTARALSAPDQRTDSPQAGSTVAPSALVAIRASPDAASALAAIVTSHAVMVAVMAMTPVHMRDDGASLTLIGLTISLHIAGMYALAPVAGWLADRAGRGPTILTGQAMLVMATLITATAGHSSARVTTGLVLLGLGWSFSTVAASTQLAEAVSPTDRPRVQGASDLLMNLAAASAGALSGLAVASIGFTGLSLLSAAAVLPSALIVAVRTTPGRAG
jgi:MFS family permease